MLNDRFFSVSAAILSCIALAVALDRNPPSSSTAQQPFLQTVPPSAEVATINSRMNVISREIENINKSLSIELQNIKYEYSWASFSPTDTSFRLLKTDYGLLMVSLQGTEKSGNGYKLYFDIGNPTSLTISGAKGRITWKSSDNTNIVEDGEKIRSKDFSILSDIYPGVWNRVAISIGPATEKTIGTIVISDLIVNTVRMSTVNGGSY